MELIRLYPEAGLLELSAVERNAEDLPVAWPIFREGDNHLTIRGHPQPVNLKLTAEDLKSIAGYHQAKGGKIPLDSRHVISNLAKELGMDEADLLAQMPRLAGTAGFGSLEHRDGALWLSDIEWLPIGAAVVKKGMIRYFSPTIKGLDGESPLRVTSVSLDNEPRLHNLPSIAAAESAGDDETVTPESHREALTKLKEHHMEDPDKKASETQPPAVDEKNTALIGILNEFFGKELTADQLKTALATLQVQADKMPEVQEQLKNLQLAEENRKLEAARTRILEKGILDQAHLSKPFFANMNSAQLSEFCDNMERQMVPVGTLELAESRPAYTPPAPDAKYASVQEAIAKAPTF